MTFRETRISAVSGTFLLCRTIHCANYRLHGSAVTCPICGFRGAVDRSNYPDRSEGEQA